MLVGDWEVVGAEGVNGILIGTLDLSTELDSRRLGEPEVEGGAGDGANGL